MKWSNTEMSERFDTMAKVFTTEINDMAHLSYAVESEVVRKISDKITEQLVTELFPQIAEKISPEAIANLAIAKGASAIKQEMEQQRVGKDSRWMPMFLRD